MRVQQPRAFAVAFQATSKKSPTTGTEPTRKSMPTLPSIRTSVSFEAPLCQAWWTIRQRDDAGHGVSDGKQADNGVQAEADIGARHCQLVVHKRVSSFL
jgi:hypothetical protein